MNSIYGYSSAFSLSMKSRILLYAYEYAVHSSGIFFPSKGTNAFFFGNALISSNKLNSVEPDSELQ